MESKETPPVGIRPKQKLLEMSLRGQLTNLDKEKFQALADHLKESVEEPPPPPCEGAVLLVRQAGWTCILGNITLYETNTWWCPDGSVVDEDRMIRTTDEPCTDVTL